MTQDPPTTPNFSAAVQAAVEQEARFKNVEAGIRECRDAQTHTVELFDLRLQEIQRDLKSRAEDLDHRHTELLDVARKALAASELTNGSVAALGIRMGRVEGLAADHSGDIEELSGGLQALRASQMAMGAKEHETQVIAVATKGLWKMQYTLILAAFGALGLAISIANGVLTFVQHVK